MRTPQKMQARSLAALDSGCMQKEQVGLAPVLRLLRVALTYSWEQAVFALGWVAA